MASEINGISSLKPDRRGDFHASISRRDWIISKIGLNELEKFEVWAFRDTCVIYDSNISLKWANIHSTKGIEEDADSAVKTMVRIWLARHSTEAKDEYPLQTIEINEWPGPGLDAEDE